CPHNRRRDQCKECKGSGICEHNRRRDRCKECGGTSICKHNRQRYQCKECGGVSVCEHNRQRQYCKECGGVSVCEHNRQRHYCKECWGTGICEHEIKRSQCRECQPRTACCQGAACAAYEEKDRGIAKKWIDGKKLCNRCVRNHPSYAPLKRNEMLRKEEVVFGTILELLPNITTWEHYGDCAVKGGCSKRRPDLRLELGVFTLIVEIDEEQHKNRSCEEKRIGELFQDLGNRPLVVIRFNPDKYTREGATHQGVFSCGTLTTQS
ncbi:unnamed protein product, partial [Phaeothamnion confervicola]